MIKYRIWQVLSVIGSFILLSAIFNWKFSIILITAIAWHESGHLFAARRLGYATHGFIFIPFVGGVSSYGDAGIKPTPSDRAYIALAGPVSGLVLSFILFCIGYIFHSNIFLAATIFNVIVNVFNLIPVGPLDGGVLVSAICESINDKAKEIFKWLSFFITMVAAFKFRSPVFWFVALLCTLDVLSNKNIIADIKPTFNKMKPFAITMYITCFFGIVCSLFSIFRATNISYATFKKILMP